MSFSEASLYASATRQHTHCVTCSSTSGSAKHDVDWLVWKEKVAGGKLIYSDLYSYHLI